MSSSPHIASTSTEENPWQSETLLLHMSMLSGLGHTILKSRQGKLVAWLFDVRYEDHVVPVHL